MADGYSDPNSGSACGGVEADDGVVLLHYTGTPAEWKKVANSDWDPAAMQVCGDVTARSGFASALNLGGGAMARADRVNRAILSQAARAMTDGTVSAVRGRLERVISGGMARPKSMAGVLGFGNGAAMLEALARSVEDFDWTYNGGGETVRGDYETRMTSVHPYVGFARDDGIGLWATLGYGRGDVRLEDRDGARGGDLDLLSAALGGSGSLWTGADGAADLRLKAEASVARLGLESGEEMEGLDVGVHRLRLGGRGPAPGLDEFVPDVVDFRTHRPKRW